MNSSSQTTSLTLWSAARVWLITKVPKKVCYLNTLPSCWCSFVDMHASEGKINDCLLSMLLSPLALLLPTFGLSSAFVNACRAHTSIQCTLRCAHLFIFQSVFKNSPQSSSVVLTFFLTCINFICFYILHFSIKLHKDC